MRAFVLIAALLLPCAAAAAAQVAVADGDSLRVGNRRVRLLGVDAPELRQSCTRPSGRAWPCGRAARGALARLVVGGPVRCRAAGKDRYGRTLARCAAGGGDLGRLLVRGGWAVALPGGGYAREERRARAAGLGVWSGGFERPSAWRAGRRRP